MRREWEALISDLAPDRLRAMEFLYTHLPESDLDCYPPQLFLRFADQALSLRGEALWCAELEEEIFCHLPFSATTIMYFSCCNVISTSLNEILCILQHL